MTKHNEKYEDKALQPFVEQLIEDHYNSIALLCADTRKQTERVRSLETQQVTSQYTLLCDNIIAETERYIDMRKGKYIPYILKLTEKVVDKHDCSGCTGNCKLDHDIQLFEIKASNQMMQNMLNKLQMASLPLHSDTIYPEEYRLLRYKMAVIETNLTELFFLENNYLIPKIVEAQKSINAGS